MRENLHDKKRVIAALTDSRHGDLKGYLSVGTDAAVADPDFYGHLVAWNAVKGSVRDAQIALPVIALKDAAARAVLVEQESASRTFAENALACIADLRPREFRRAIEFGWDIGAPTRMLKRLMIRYVRNLEANRHHWEPTALRHRDTLRWMYAQANIPVRIHGGESALFGRVRNITKFGVPMETDRGVAPGRFRVFADLPNLSSLEIAGMIDKFKLPFLNVRDALGVRAQETDVVMALMKRMSPTEIVSNMKWLEKVGVKTNPALRSTLESVLGDIAKPKRGKRQKTGILKTSKAAEVLAGDEVLSTKLHAAQERQLEQVGSIDGNWLVLADKSGSMEHSMELAKLVASTLARLVSGKVYLVFFDTTPRFYEVTSMTLEQIRGLTETITAGGGTSIGCGVRLMTDRKVDLDGIAIISDGCENRGCGSPFATEYRRYAKAMDKEPTVYWYRTMVKISADILQAAMRRYSLTEKQMTDEFRRSAADEVNYFMATCRTQGVDLSETTYDLSNTTDYHSVLALVPTMRVARFALLDEILSTPLWTLDRVLDKTTGEPVLPQRQPVHA